MIYLRVNETINWALTTTLLCSVGRYYYGNPVFVLFLRAHSTSDKHRIFFSGGIK